MTGARGERPPPPHDPLEREVIARADGWEVRQFARTDRRFDYFRLRGFLHLQLWHPAERTSILTPSRLTRGLFDVMCGGATLLRARRWTLVAAALVDRIAMPGVAELRALERWFILRHEPADLHLLRAWWDEEPRAARSFR